RRTSTGALAPAPEPQPAALPSAAPVWLRPVAVALLCAGLALALLPLVPAVAPARYVLPSPLPTAAVLVASGGGRGRTEATLSPVAVVTRAPLAASAATASAAASSSPSVLPRATPTSSPKPSPSPTPAPSPSVAPVVAPTQLPAAATPSPGVTPGPVAPGYSRLIVLVVDETTLEPVAGACIVIGAPDCSPSRPHTNSAGLWWVDFPTGQMAGTQWPVQVSKDGYATLAAVVTTSGTSQQFVAPLQPLR
ncbi:MAG: hypothetical protein KGQ88_08690, partial [Chloroflexi bacterium]|nr:hypothetical protein [Chloroflexota bacterium]